MMLVIILLHLNENTSLVKGHAQGVVLIQIDSHYVAIPRDSTASVITPVVVLGGLRVICKSIIANVVLILVPSDSADGCHLMDVALLYQNEDIDS